MESEIVFVRKLAFVCQLENPAELFVFDVLPQTSRLMKCSLGYGGCLGCNDGSPL